MVKFELPLPAELRYVYRSLLRAATYLPDPFVRSYVHGRIVGGFRATSDKIRFRARDGEMPQLILDRYHGHKHLLYLQRTVNKLERANSRSAEDLKDIFMRAYGRLGRRRRELLTKFLAADEDDLPYNDQILEHLINNQSKEKPDRFGPDSKFTVLCKSQLASQTDLVRASRRLRRNDNKIPTENSWGRPMPRKLALSLEKKNFAWTLDRLWPPLPDHEWNRLRDLATGVIPTEQPRQRRPKVGGPESFSGQEHDLALLRYFTTPIEVSKPRLNPVTLTPAGLTVWKPESPDMSHKKLSTLSARHMRRIYSEIWCFTPKMTKCMDTKKWIVDWGYFSPEAAGKISLPGPADLELFETNEDVKLSDNKKVRPTRAGNKTLNKPKHDSSRDWTIDDCDYRSIVLDPRPLEVST